MKYTLNDTNAYGIYNGISPTAIRDYTRSLAKDLGLCFTDYNIENMARQLSKDPKLKELAEAAYVPFPEDEHWSEEYKAKYHEMVAKRTAPGEGDVSDEIVYEAVLTMLVDIADRVLPSRNAELEKRASEYALLMKHIRDYVQEEKTVTDEKGKAKGYHITVYMKDGDTLSFLDRNIFDFGRIVCPLYTIKNDVKASAHCINENGVLTWATLEGKTLRPLTENEKYAMRLIVNYCGHHRSSIRM